MLSKLHMFFFLFSSNRAIGLRIVSFETKLKNEEFIKTWLFYTMNGVMPWVRLTVAGGNWWMLFRDGYNPEKFLVDYYAAVANKIRTENNQQFMIFKFLPYSGILTTQNTFLPVTHYISEKFGDHTFFISIRQK